VAKEKLCFTISKRLSSYLITVQGNEVTVAPLQNANRYNSGRTIANTLQIIGNTRLVLDTPRNPFQFLKDFYTEKGWQIENEQ
jgi:hypothetical protein